MTAALTVSNLHHRYGDRVALGGVSFAVAPGELFALLGPNGGGKTTLFRIASTLLAPTAGTVQVFGADVSRHPHEVRRRIGVMFQSAAIDARLTVAENLGYHGRLFGIRGGDLRDRTNEALRAVQLGERAGDIVGTLSGGLQRRVELAKTLMTRPDLLLLDEPTTGLDPSARREVREHLLRLREGGMTIVMTTHLMDEAAVCDRVAILHQGMLAALAPPRELVEAVGGDVLLITARAPQDLAAAVADRFGVAVDLYGDRLRVELRDAHAFVPTLVEAFPGDIDAVTVGRPTLEDAFVHFTGERLE